MTGADFRVVRGYTSNLEYVGAGLVGEHWTLSNFASLSVTGSGTSRKLYLPILVRRELEYLYDSGSQSWKAKGPTAQYIIEADVTIGTDKYAVWRHIQPGKGHIDFYREHDASGGFTATPAELEGLILRQEDVYGNRHDYDYTIYGTGLGAGKQHARLTTVTLVTADSVEEAKIEFTWIENDQSPHLGRLQDIRVKRDDGQSWVETQRVAYAYKEDGDGLSNALGTEGDLIDVRKRVKVDTSTATLSTWRTLITQYRYHGGQSNETTTDTDGDGFIEFGKARHLKMLFTPEQMEFFAQGLANNDANVDNLDEAADELLTLDDGDDWHTGASHIVADAAAKVVADYETGPGVDDSRVQQQFIQSDCGCGGGPTQGMLLEYAYYHNTVEGEEEQPLGPPIPFTEHYYTTRIDVKKWNDDTSQWDLHLTQYIDLEPRRQEPDEVGAVAYPINFATVDGSNKWVIHKSLMPSGEISQLVTPSAMFSYTPATASQEWSYSAKSDEGLALAYTYTSDHRRKESYVREGYVASPLSSYTLVSRITYGDGSDDEPIHLPIKVESFRVAGSTANDDVETTEYIYGFHSTSDEDIAWVETKVEAEEVAENGPDGRHSSYELFDDAGRNFWSRAGDKALTQRTFTDGPGVVASIVANSDTTGLPATHAGLSTSGWGRNADGGSLTTNYTHDLLGRIQRIEAPGGVNAYTWREMRTSLERPGIDYYAEISLPHEVSATPLAFNAPAQATTFNGGGAAIESRAHVITTSHVETGGALDDTFDSSTDLGTELTRSVVTHDVSGLVTQQEVWYDIADDKSHITANRYDALGRLETTTNPNGTVTRLKYDIFDRVIEEEVGTDASGTGSDNMTTVAKYYFDSSGTASQGVGNGTVTRTETYDGVNTRATKHTYDFRDRRIKTENPPGAAHLHRLRQPEPPHQAGGLRDSAHGHRCGWRAD